jgi:MtN3 and saliva related transmembrane protein
VRARFLPDAARMDFTPYLGYIAGSLTVISYVPQAIRAWRTKQVDDLSWMMVAMLVAAGALWITYGIASSQTPVILTNVATTILTAAILVAKFKFGRSSRQKEKRGAPGRPAPAREPG